MKYLQKGKKLLCDTVSATSVFNVKLCHTEWGEMGKKLTFTIWKASTFLNLEN